jgi:hypothetical protein
MALKALNIFIAELTKSASAFSEFANSSIVGGIFLFCNTWLDVIQPLRFTLLNKSRILAKPLFRA